MYTPLPEDNSKRENPEVSKKRSVRAPRGGQGWGQNGRLVLPEQERAERDVPATGSLSIGRTITRSAGRYHEAEFRAQWWSLALPASRP